MIQELLVGDEVNIVRGGMRVTEKCMASLGNENQAVDVATGDGQQAGLKCPRCDSTNTKFCYYNNYNLSQPRYFCKSCRRYWTKGGALRNVPIGGGCRKNKLSAARSGKLKPETAGNSKTTTNNNWNELYSSSSTVNATSAPSLLMPQTPTSLSSFLHNSCEVDPHKYVGIMNPPGNHNSSLMLSRSALDVQNLDSISFMNAGRMWKNGSFDHYNQHQQLNFNQQRQRQFDDRIGAHGVGNFSGGGFQELCQRLRAMSNSYEEQHHHTLPVMGGISGVDATSLAIGNLGFRGSNLLWSDLHPTAGASFLEENLR